MKNDEIAIKVKRNKMKNDKKPKTKTNHKPREERAVSYAAHKKHKKRDKNKRKNSIENGALEKSKNSIMKNGMILALVIIAILLVFSSNVFSIKEIQVEGNTKISDEEIISFSNIQKYSNMFHINKYASVQNIKKNAYIESVKIKRKLPNTIKIMVEEREVNYMLQFADSYVYINNQGYILEISNKKLEVPILAGITTDLSNIQAGNRMNLEDLNKMDMVIKIFESAKTNDMGNLISKIDISNDENYTLVLETEGKTVYLGDCSQLNTRMILLKGILEVEKGKVGEVFLNIDLNTRKAYFRENVQ